MDRQTEEGLCELAAYLYLLSLSRSPLEDASMHCIEADIRQQIYWIESNAHSTSGSGFRRCVESLRGRKLHDLLSFVREHGRYPPPLPTTTSGLGFDSLS